MKIGVAIQGCTEEKLRDALSKSSGPVHATHEFQNYIWPAVVFEAEDLGDGHGYYATREEFLVYAFEWVLRWRLGVPIEAECITADGYVYNSQWIADLTDKIKATVDGVVISRDEAMACICAIGCTNNEGCATRFDMRLEARLREAIGVTPNEYLTPPAN